MNQVLKHYLDIARQLHGPIVPEDALSEEEIARHEHRLGVRFPLLLRAIYQITGQNQSMHQSEHHLFLPAEWEIKNGCVVFYCETQAVVTWGISITDISSEDPPIYEIGWLEGEKKIAYPSMRAFLLVTLCWQAIASTRWHTGIGRISDQKIIDDIHNHWQPIQIDNNTSILRFFVNRSSFLCIIGHTIPVSICIQAKSKIDVEVLAQHLQINDLFEPIKA